MIRIVQAITPVHVGEGQTVGSVDLPIARERHTGLPTVPGTSLKGALRSRCRRLGAPPERVREVFGSEPGQIPLSRGEVSISDAALIALSVRCLARGAALLTSPLLLGRLARWLDDAPPIPRTSVERAKAADHTDFVVPELDRVVLEDLDLLVETDEAVGVWAEAMARWLGDDAPLDRLLLVHDDVLAFAAEAWIPIRTRASIDADGVVRDGHLFTVEALPPESLLFTIVRGHDQRLLPPDGEVFTVGGHVTIGSGRMAWYGGR